MSADDNFQLPTSFDANFLNWFRERTEATWSRYKARTFEEFKNSGAGGVDWQRGTSWLHGLSAEEISSIELHWQLCFPPDYHLFLTLLHFSLCNFNGDEGTPRQRALRPFLGVVE